MIGLDQTAAVYQRGTTGAFDTLVYAGVRCRLAHVRGGNSAPERAELLALRQLLWEPGYVMPEHQIQVEVGGLRWNPTPGTYGALRGPSGTVVYRRCDVTRASEVS
jgi:hypothetical protein